MAICPAIVSRVEWGAAKESKLSLPFNFPVTQIVLAQTTSPLSCDSVESCKREIISIQKSHIENWNFGDIAYNFLIGNDGTIFEGRGWFKQGSYLKGQDNISFEIAFIGPFGVQSKAKPSAAALNSAVQLVNCALSKQYIRAENLTIVNHSMNPDVIRDFRNHPESPEKVIGWDRWPEQKFNWTSIYRIASPTSMRPSVNEKDTTEHPVQLEGVPVASVIAGIFLLALASLVAFWWMRRGKKLKWSFKEKIRLPIHIVNRYEIARNRLDVTKDDKNLLGSGNFGVVMKGRLKMKDENALTDWCEIAVKMLPDRMRGKVLEKYYFDNFLVEMEMLMKTGRHVNIVNLIGFVLEEEPMIVMEYCYLGSLEKFLQDAKNVTCFTGNSTSITMDSSTDQRYDVFKDRIIKSPHALSSVNDLINFGFQISRGMEFVSSRNIIHRDLAARNILLDGARKAKISDFGMARDQGHYILLRENVEVPMRWMALESLMKQNGAYNTKTDVWSFGVTLWEIFTLCQLPYQQEFPGGVVRRQLLEFLISNQRLGCPKYSTEKVFEIMNFCWDADPTARPTFAQITTELSNLLPVEVRTEYLAMDEEYDAFNNDLQHSYEFILYV